MPFLHADVTFTKYILFWVSALKCIYHLICYKYKCYLHSTSSRHEVCPSMAVVACWFEFWINIECWFEFCSIFMALTNWYMFFHTIVALAIDTSSVLVWQCRPIDTSSAPMWQCWPIDTSSAPMWQCRPIDTSSAPMWQYWPIDTSSASMWQCWPIDTSSAPVWNYSSIDTGSAPVCWYWSIDKGLLQDSGAG